MKFLRFVQHFNCYVNNFRLYSCICPLYFKSVFSQKFRDFNEIEYPTYPRQFSRFSSLLKEDSHEYKTQDETDSLISDPQTLSFTNRLYRHPGTFHNILIIQPKERTEETTESAERKLAEAVALIQTLPNWRVVDKLIIPTSKLQSAFIFGSGNLEKIKSIVQKNMSVSAVFIGIDIMSSLQNTNLEDCFKMQVFDRYQIILQIFHDHAHTKEAKLQLALAEIPYLRVKLASFSHTRDATTFSGIHHVGGDGETFMEKRRRILNERELKLKKALEKVKTQREFLRNAERRSNHPIIAVVGYTNCGKTSLIRSLTNDERLLPENKLFATLDVTLHSGRLPSNQKILFIDTVGFISDVPTTLIQSFRSTLEEITLADLVIHVRDISHPHTEQQKETVLKTLQQLDLPQKLLDSILEVRNKIDLVENLPDYDDPDALYISATEGTGLPKLLEVTEQRILQNTDHSVSLIRVPSGGEEYRWLMKEGAIRDSLVDNTDANYIILEVILSAAKLGKFKHRYGDMTVKLEDIIN